MSLSTISKEYLEQQKMLHENPHYGVASLSFAPIVTDFINQTGIKSVSDYGAGKQNLLTGLHLAGINSIDYYSYDPVFAEYGEPRSADLVCCIDVLEHIEPERLENVLIDLAKITLTFGFSLFIWGLLRKLSRMAEMLI